uniref:Epithelial membrane protein 3 n=1 Tax=Strigops habroptila TaxID=2489341 RepID=A0A672U4Q3_STRHB
MSFLLFALTGLHGLGLLLLFIATLGKAWWVLPDGGTLNLWYDCEYLNSTHGWACTSTGDSREHRGAVGHCGARGGRVGHRGHVGLLAPMGDMGCVGHRAPMG